MLVIFYLNDFVAVQWEEATITFIALNILFYYASSLRLIFAQEKKGYFGEEEIAEDDNGEKIKRHLEFESK